MSEIIERVARAMADKFEDHFGGEVALSDHLSQKMARAAIEAMREPTEEMKDLGANGVPDRPCPYSGLPTEEAHAAEIWGIMIDAALAPTSPPDRS